jgi:hypothetical protein
VISYSCVIKEKRREKKRREEKRRDEKRIE